MTEHFHSVTLDRDKCKGCTNCIKRCPIEAIRVRAGKACIIEERCIDCGECIRICPNHAKIAVSDTMEVVAKFRHAIALPAPSLFGQFRQEVSPSRVLGALLEVGFDEVFEVAVAAEAVSYAFRRALKLGVARRPMISSACPAVIRLMQVRFPSLLDHIVRIKSPMEVAARLAKERALADGRFKPEEVGAFFITPCPAKVTAVKQPVGTSESAVDGVISMSLIYGEVLTRLDRGREVAPQATAAGIGWGRAGGEAMAVGRGTLLAVDGIHYVISVLEELERGRLGDVDFIEAQACVGGCVGGPLVVQNPFVARVRLRQLAEQHWDKRSVLDMDYLEDRFARGYFDMRGEILPRPVMKLDEDIDRAIVKMKLLEETLERLPGLDCGSCGSPSCRALAEDIVRQDAMETDCIFKLRERVQELAEQVVDLARKVPPAMSTESEKGGEER